VKPSPNTSPAGRPYPPFVLEEDQYRGERRVHGDLLHLRQRFLQGKDRIVLRDPFLVGTDTTYPTARITVYPAIWALCFQNQGQMAGYARGRPAHIPPPCPRGMEGRAPGTRSLQASDPVQSCYKESAVSDQESRSTWARLIAQVYEGCAPRCPPRVSALPVTHEGDCRDHRSGRGHKNPAAPGEDRPIPSGAGSELRVISNLSPSCRLRGMRVSFTGFPVLQRNSLMPQDCARLLCQRDFYCISVAHVRGCTA